MDEIFQKEVINLTKELSQLKGSVETSFQNLNNLLTKFAKDLDELVAAGQQKSLDLEKYKSELKELKRESKNFQNEAKKKFKEIDSKIKNVEKSAKLKLIIGAILGALGALAALITYAEKILEFLRKILS